MLRARRPAAPPATLSLRRPPRRPLCHSAGRPVAPAGSGIACGVTAWYVAFAHVANATFGRELFPVWALK